MPSINKKTFLKSEPKGGLTLREMFTRPLIYGTSPSSPKWSPDNKTLAFLWNESGEPVQDICVSRGDDSTPVRLTDASSIAPLPVEDDERPKDDVDYAEVMWTGIAGFDWLTKDASLSAEQQWIVYLCRGNLFKAPISGGQPVRLTKSSQGMGSLKVSPDGRKIGFLMNSNVWAYDVTDGSTAQLSFFSRDQVAVHRFEWSPDSKHIAILVQDQSMWEKVKMPDYSPEKEVKIVELRRNNVGKPLPKARIGIIPAEGGKMSRIALPLSDGQARNGDAKPDEIDTGDNIWLHSMSWTNDSSRFLVAYTGKDYTDFHICAVEPGKEDAPTELYTEHSEPWAHYAPAVSSPASDYVYFASYKSGWRRLYRVPVTGGDPQPLTEDGFDITEFVVPKNGSKVIFTACWPYPAEQNVFTLPLDGGEPEKVSPSLTSSSVIASDDGSALAFVSSGVMVPPEIYRQAGSSTPEKLTNSTLPAFSKIAAPQVKRFSYVNESDGSTVSGKMILPHNFDPTKKYPVVLSCVYAGQGKESFTRYQMLDTYMANEMGYILVGIDLRASIGYGRDFFYGYHKKLGLIDSDECVSCAQYLKSLPYVDGKRIGIWGGSYGGFLVLMVMCNHPGVFHTGVSWKPVTDWRNYWDSYTCQRLGRPQDDPEIYKATSPVFHAEGLEGNLLVVHGVLDDNVLFQDAIWMIQKMIESGKYFDLMIYPRDDHGLTLRHESLPDCMERFAAYFEEHMGLGPV
jgi:dipeptidyl-peptidase-4